MGGANGRVAGWEEGEAGCVLTTNVHEWLCYRFALKIRNRAEGQALQRKRVERSLA